MEGFLLGVNDTGFDPHTIPSVYNEPYFGAENVTVKESGDGGPASIVEWSNARIQRVITLVLLMSVSFIGNSVIIFILSCSRYHRNLNRVKIFIINLAIGDLAVCCVTMSSELVFEVREA